MKCNVFLFKLFYAGEEGALVFIFVLLLLLQIYRDPPFEKEICVFIVLSTAFNCNLSATLV